jgi:hypothetical protein
VLCVCEFPPINLRMPEPVLMKLDMYIMAPESILRTYFINPFHQFVCQYVYSPIVARQRLDKNVTAVTRNCWRRRFLCDPCRVEGKETSSSQNVLFKCVYTYKPVSVLFLPVFFGGPDREHVR